MMRLPQLLQRLQDKRLKNREPLQWPKQELKRQKEPLLQFKLRYKLPLRNSKRLRLQKPQLSKLKRIDLLRRQD
jgi:hypothetical protein